MGLRKKKSLVDQALGQAGDVVDTLRPHVESAIYHAKDFVQDTAIPALQDARDKAGPVLADARDKAAPVVADARSKAAPLVASGVALAADKATAAKIVADAKVAQLKGEPPKKKGGKLKKIAVVALVGAAAAAVAKKLRGSGSSDNWQSSYAPTPAPAATSPVETPAKDVEDRAGAAPDEAIADAAEAPHPVTTPDEPAEVVDIDTAKSE